MIDDTDSRDSRVKTPLLELKNFSYGRNHIELNLHTEEIWECECRCCWAEHGLLYTVNQTGPNRNLYLVWSTV